MRRSARPRRWPRSSATARGLARAAIGASRRYMQPPGVVDEELIAMLEQALAMTERRAHGRPRAAAGAPVRRAVLLARRDEMADAQPPRRPTIAAELGDPEARALAAAAPPAGVLGTRRTCEQRLADSTELLTLARRGRRHRARRSRATRGSWSTCSSTATRRGRRADARRSRAAPSACASRCTCGHAADVAGDARAAGRARSSEPTGWPRRRWRPGSHGEAVTAPQYYAIQLLAIRREQGRMGELEQRRPRAGGRQPRPAGLARRAGRPAAVGDRPARRGARGVRAARRARLRARSRATATG